MPRNTGTASSAGTVPRPGPGCIEVLVAVASATTPGAADRDEADDPFPHPQAHAPTARRKTDVRDGEHRPAAFFSRT